MAWIIGGGGAKRRAGRTKPPFDASAAQVVASDSGRLPRRSKPSLGLRVLPRFQTMAYDELVQSSDLISQSRLQLRKAFTPAQPIGDRWMFAGRTGLLSRIISGIEDQRLHTVIYGPRGIGKTSITRALSQIAEDARYRTIYISCDTAASFDELFRTIATTIPLMFHQNYGPTSPEAERGGTFADLLPPSPVSVSAASDLCTHLIGAHLLIVLDEFDRCRTPGFRRNVAEFLKNLSDRAVGAQLVITGVAKNLEELIGPDPMIQRNILAVEVPRMDAEEVGQLLANGEDLSGLSFSPEAKAKIVSASGGLPYLASLLGQHAGLAALSAGRLEVLADDVSGAIDAAIIEMGERTPKRSLIELRRCSQGGEIKHLARLAQFSQSQKGEISANDLPALFQDHAERAKAVTLLARLGANGNLLRHTAGEGGARFEFVDEGILPLIGLLSSQNESELAEIAQPAGAQVSPPSPV